MYLVQYQNQIGEWEICQTCHKEFDYIPCVFFDKRDAQRDLDRWELHDQETKYRVVKWER